MSDYHCLEIEFPEVDFSPYYRNSKVELNKTYHAHLYTNNKEIELKIFIEEDSNFDEILMSWSLKINRNQFGKFLKVTKTENHTNEGIEKIDLSDTRMVQFKSSTNFYENGSKLIVITLDSIKKYRNQNLEEINTGEFYLDEKGFRVVESFYNHLMPKNFLKDEGLFEIKRLKTKEEFIHFEKCSFRPEFDFIFSDKPNQKVANITKQPKIKFIYKEDTTEEEAILYIKIVLSLASFYYHVKIDFVFSRINLSKNTIIIKKIENENFFDTRGNLWGFEIKWNFFQFLKATWQEETIKNFKLISKAIELFNQSFLVDNSSTFLIRYNIIEICDKKKIDNTKFQYVINLQERELIQQEALELLLKTVAPEEHEEFAKRWENVLTNLQNRPMKNQLVSFLESQNLELNNLPIDIKVLKKLRDCITHGSLEKVNPQELRKANILLYRISGILILNLMGIKDWKLNTEIN